MMDPTSPPAEVSREWTDKGFCQYPLVINCKGNIIITISVCATLERPQVVCPLMQEEDRKKRRTGTRFQEVIALN